MWGIIAILLVASCTLSAEQHQLNIAAEHDLELLTAAPEKAVAEGNSRIFGGSPVPIEWYPFAVQVLYTFNDQLVCGGALITRSHVLSAAHCFRDERGSILSDFLFFCRVGTATLNSGGSRRDVSRIVSHEEFHSQVLINDIAVLVLASPVTLSSTIALAPLPPQDYPVPDNTGLWVVGWGRTHPVVQQAASLLYGVQVVTFSSQLCRQLYLDAGVAAVTTDMMCTGIGRGSCEGDGGGPVLWGSLLVGIKSWGEGCANDTYPDVNTRVAAYTDWISETVDRYSGAPSLGQTSVVLLFVSLLSTLFGHTL